MTSATDVSHVATWSQRAVDRLAFSTLACPEWRFEEAVDAAVRFGYRGLELRLLDGEVVQPSLPEREIVRIAEALHRARR